jgi:hypothetical protein
MTQLNGKPHIVVFFVVFDFTVFYSILHYFTPGAFISPFLSVIGSLDLMPFDRHSLQIHEFLKPTLKPIYYQRPGCRVERFIGMEYRKMMV